MREMFYNYLNSIYNIVEKYKSNYNCFHDMIALNDYFIDNLTAKNIATVQNIHSFHNQTGGNDPIIQLKALNQAITDIINEIVAAKGQQYDFTELQLKMTQFSNAAKKLVAYIELLHKIAPTQPEMMKLIEQLIHINTILNKY
jgi:hypothetical protein